MPKKKTNKPKSTKLDPKVTGLFWHVHHEPIAEWSHNIIERIRYIKREKSEFERPKRLRLIKPVSLLGAPKELKRIVAYCRKLQKTRDKRYAPDTWVAFDFWRCNSSNHSILVKMHKKQCGCDWSERNGINFYTP